MHAVASHHSDLRPVLALAGAGGGHSASILEGLVGGGGAAPLESMASLSCSRPSRRGSSPQAAELKAIESKASHASEGALALPAPRSASSSSGVRCCDAVGPSGINATDELARSVSAMASFSRALVRNQCKGQHAAANMQQSRKRHVQGPILTELEPTWCSCCL